MRRRLRLLLLWLGGAVGAPACATFHAPAGGPGASLVACYHLRDLGCGVVSVEACRSTIGDRIDADPAAATCLDAATTCEEANACL